MSPVIKGRDVDDGRIKFHVVTSNDPLVVGDIYILQDLEAGMKEWVGPCRYDGTEEEMHPGNRRKKVLMIIK